MTLVHDLIKMKYVDEGFLPDYPYHLISDEEMVKGFLNLEGKYDFFRTTYPLPDEEFKPEYDKLLDVISKELSLYLMSTKDGGTIHMIPDWIYSYMLGTVIGPYSPQKDKHDLFVLLGTDNIDDEFLPNCYRECYRVSEKWLQKYSYRELTPVMRCPTIFGEAHVIKYLRLQQADIIRGGGANAVS